MEVDFHFILKWFKDGGNNFLISRKILEKKD